MVNGPGYDIKNVILSNNCRVSYVDEGQGDKTLLFIHGLANYSLSWRKNIDELKNHFRCIAIDLPGNGHSDRGDFPYSINFFAGAAYDFILKLQLKNVHIVGHSMGGQIALTLLANEPSAAQKLILCAPAGFEVFNTFERNIYQASINFLDLFSSEENSLRQSIRSSFYHYPEQANELIQELVGQMKSYPIRTYRNMIEKCIAAMLNEPVFDKLHTIKQQTLVIFGERDALIPNKIIHPSTTKQVGETGVKQMLAARLEMIPRCGHFVHWEKAAEVNRLMHDFCRTS